MGFHQYDSDFTLDPRLAMNDDTQHITRGLGNQVTVEFNLLYRFHCAISQKDEQYTEKFIKRSFGAALQNPDLDPKELSLPDFLKGMAILGQMAPPKEPWDVEFGIPVLDPNAPSDPDHFKRNPITGLFDDQQMIKQLLKDMDDPICEFVSSFSRIV
jgi:hypothetical protein